MKIPEKYQRQQKKMKNSTKEFYNTLTSTQSFVRLFSYEKLFLSSIFVLAEGWKENCVIKVRYIQERMKSYL